MGAIGSVATAIATFLLWGKTGKNIVHAIQDSATIAQYIPQIRLVPNPKLPQREGSISFGEPMQLYNLGKDVEILEIIDEKKLLSPNNANILKEPFIENSVVTFLINNDIVGSLVFENYTIKLKLRNLLGKTYILPIFYNFFNGFSIGNLEEDKKK